MTHLSLFSGIGGLDLASEWAGFEIAGQCEFADYPYKILCKHWPNVPKWRDVHDLTAKSFFDRTGLKTVDCISGGFPCQPHSLAGKRRASRDDRDLWPEFRRIISEVKPKWVVAENVRGLLSSEDGRFFRGILRDLSDLGFDAGWCTYPAAWVGAIHRRERVFTIAHTTSVRLEKPLEIQNFIEKISKKQPSNSFSGHLTEYGNDQFGSDSELRNDDGVSNRMDRLKCLGNAVVPQQFYPVFKAIWEAEHEQP